MLVVSSVAALLGGVPTASSIVMLGICCQQEVRTVVFSSEFLLSTPTVATLLFSPQTHSTTRTRTWIPHLRVQWFASGTGFRVGGSYVNCFSVEASVRTGT